MVNLASLTSRELANYKAEQANIKRNKAAKKKNKNKIKKKPLKMDRKSVEDREMEKLEKIRDAYKKKQENKTKKSSTRIELEKLNAEANRLFNKKNSNIIKKSVDNSGIPESKAILKAFNELKKLLKMK